MKFISAVTAIPINAGHFNSPGMEKRGRYDVATVKYFNKEGKRISFISPQALRSFIREYIEHETNQPNYYDRLLGNEKIKLDPIKFFADDFFGYSQPLGNNPNENCYQDRLKVASTNRRSPFLTNGLIGIENLNNIASSEGWVHPMKGTPLPYKAEFSTGIFQGTFTLELSRIGRFENYGDIIEIDPALLKIYSEELKKTRSPSQKDIFEIKNRTVREKRSFNLFFDCILNLYGGAKSTMFGESLHPNVLVASGRNVSMSLPTSLFISNPQGNLTLDILLLKDYIKSWKKSFDTPIFIGYRNNSFQKAEEQEIQDLNGQTIEGVEIKLTTPGKIKRQMEKYL